MENFKKKIDKLLNTLDKMDERLTTFHKEINIIKVSMDERLTCLCGETHNMKDQTKSQK